MRNLIYFGVVIFLLGSGIWKIYNFSGEFQDLNILQSREPIESLLSSTPSKKDIAVKEDWEEIMVGDFNVWAFKYTYKAFEVINTYEGTTEYTPDRGFTSYVTLKNYRSPYSSKRVRENRKDLEYTFGGTVYGRANFDAPGLYWEEQISSCHDEKKEEGVCSSYVVGSTYKYGTFDKGAERFKLVKFNDNHILMEGYDYSTEATITYELKRKSTLSEND